MAISKFKCPQKVKGEDLKVIPCPGRSTSMGCSNKKNHMLKFKSGFCHNGACEGKRKLGPKSGLPQMTCRAWLLCPCSCHAMLDEMFTLSGEERRLVDNSGYVVDDGGFRMPTAEERIRMHALSSPTPVAAPVYVESVAPDLVPASIVRSYAATATGRNARGELESYVREVCDAWLVDKDYYKGVPCVPKLISSEIASNHGINPPSTGAIDAVLKRWQAVGFAELATKPARFVKYTEAGLKYGLEELKARKKRSEKSRALLRSS